MAQNGLTCILYIIKNIEERKRYLKLKYIGQNNINWIRENIRGNTKIFQPM